MNKISLEQLKNQGHMQRRKQIIEITAFGFIVKHKKYNIEKKNKTTSFFNLKAQDFMGTTLTFLES